MKLICPRCEKNPKEIGAPYCAECHAAKQREWRSKNPMTDEQRMKANARSYLHVYVKRGKVKKGPCEVCGATEVEAHHDDYTKPLEVRWRCKDHHLELHGAVART